MRGLDRHLITLNQQTKVKWIFAYPCRGVCLMVRALHLGCILQQRRQSFRTLRSNILGNRHATYWAFTGHNGDRWVLLACLAV